MKNYARIALSFLLLLISAVLELRLKLASGWSFDFLLLALLIPPMFLSLREFLLFEAFSLWLFSILYSWSYLPLALLAAMPFAVFLFKSIFPWQSWLLPFAVALIGIVAFYSIVSPGLFLGSLGFVLFDLCVSFFVAWVYYGLFYMIDE